MKRFFAFFALIFIFQGASASSCFDDFEAPVQVLRDYYSDLKTRDAKLLFKYFGGKEFLEVYESYKKSADDKNKAKLADILMFGEFSQCQIFIQVKCLSSNSAVVTYVGKKEGTKHPGESQIWMLQSKGVWKIDDKMLLKGASKHYHPIIASGECRAM